MLRAFFNPNYREKKRQKSAFSNLIFQIEVAQKIGHGGGMRRVVNRATYVPDPKINRTASAPTRESPRSGRIPTYYRRCCIVGTIASERQK